jgi:Ca-activated chloride channel family protein
MRIFRGATAAAALRAVAIVASCATCWTAQAQQSSSQGRTFRSGVDVTGITVSVRDADGHLVQDLTRDDFEIYEDGEKQPLTQFTQERVPVSLGVLLDISDSMFGQRITDARAAVDRFLFEQLNNEDEFFILAFNHKPHVLTQWTQTPVVVHDALEGIKPTGGTAVYDAVIDSMPLIAKRNKERGALLIVSDGADTASTATLKDVQAALRRSQAFVYAIAIDSPDRRAINRSVNPTTLREITNESGGRTEIVQRTTQIADAAASIADELNHQYVMGFTPAHPPDGTFHTLRVRTKNSAYKVQARRGYVADIPKS